MPANESRELAESMIRLYGKAKAYNLADRYAKDCTNNGDHHGHARWAGAAAVIGELIDLDERFAFRSP
jgi:2-methylcitrate dehydratase PrpD